jgi:hypothetical protein
MPVSGESVTPFQPNSGVVVLPRMIALSSHNLATAGASSSHCWPGSTSVDPAKVGNRFVKIVSFTVIGTPSSLPTAELFRHLASDCRASARIRSRSGRFTNTFSPLYRSPLSRLASTTSTGDKDPRSYLLPRSAAPKSEMSADINTFAHAGWTKSMS